MINILFFILLIWIIIKISKFISRVHLIKDNLPKKENDNRKSGMDIMDADYEEVE